MSVVAAYIDEVSMIASDQFLQCDVRLRQANMNSDARFGNLVVNICGDYDKTNEDGKCEWSTAH